MSRLTELAAEIDRLADQWTHASAARLKHIAAELVEMDDAPATDEPAQSTGESI